MERSGKSAGGELPCLGLEPNDTFLRRKNVTQKNVLASCCHQFRLKIAPPGRRVEITLNVSAFRCAVALWNRKRPL